MSDDLAEEFWRIFDLAYDAPRFLPSTQQIIDALVENEMMREAKRRERAAREDVG